MFAGRPLFAIPLFWQCCGTLDKLGYQLVPLFYKPPVSIPRPQWQRDSSCQAESP